MAFFMLERSKVNNLYFSTLRRYINEQRQVEENPRAENNEYENKQKNQ